MESLKRHTDYGHQALQESHLLPDPIAQFESWLKQAEEANIYEPNAFVLATVDESGSPTGRTVLLKGVNGEGFFFATNYQSRKGLNIELRANVSMVFGWYSLHRQVLIDGVAIKATNEQSDAYFESRPRDSQLAAWASNQSANISDRHNLELQFNQVKLKFEGEKIPRPPFWGGYVVKPQRIEFWQGRSNRLHDRVEYRLESGAWLVNRLQP